jgi:hypothetical protein
MSEISIACYLFGAAFGITGAISGIKSLFDGKKTNKLKTCQE